MVAGATMRTEAFHAEVGFLDVAVVLAESWKLIVALPLAAVSLTYLLCSIIPTGYTATMEISLPAVEDQSVLTPVLRAAFASSEGVSVKFDDAFLTLSVSKSGPDTARAALAAARSSMVEAANMVVDEQDARRADLLARLPNPGDGLVLAFLRDQLFPGAQDHIKLEQWTTFAGTASIEVQPNRPGAPVFAAVAAIFAAMAAIFIALMRDGWRRAANTPSGSRKIARIRAAFGRI